MILIRYSVRLTAGYGTMEAYANEACRTVAAQVSEAVGFQAMTQSTADTLAEVLASYIEEVRRPTHRRQVQQGWHWKRAWRRGGSDRSLLLLTGVGWLSLVQVGYYSHSLTEVSNRTHDNVLDVRQALLQCGTSISDLQVCARLTH